MNSATCFSKKQEFEQVGLICTLILDFNPRHVKARFRRASAAVEMGKKVCAYYDLLAALEVNPSNKEVKQKFQQVTESLHVKTKRKPDPIGLGSRLATGKRKALMKSAAGAIANGESHVFRDVAKVSVGAEKVEGLKEDNEKKDEMMGDCESGVNFEGHEDYKIGRASRSRSECEKSREKARDNNKKENARQEAANLGEVKSSSLKTIHPAEPNYWFNNRKKASSYLSISRKDY